MKYNKLSLITLLSIGAPLVAMEQEQPYKPAMVTASQLRIIGDAYPEGTEKQEPTLALANELFRAVKANDIAKAQQILDNSTDAEALINFPGQNIHPLRIAAEGGNIPMIELLIRNNANVDGITSDGIGDSNNMTPLMIAVLQGYADVAYKLIELGADVNAKDGSGQSVSNWVTFGQIPQAAQQKLLQLLKEKGATQ